MQRGIVQLLS